MKDKRYLPEPKVCERYGVSHMAPRRWDADPELDFPKPIIIRGRKYRDLDALEAFEERQRARDPQITAWEPRANEQETKGDAE